MAGHLHPVTDTDVRFKVNAITRRIQTESGKVALIQGDHKSERFTFEIPRMVDGHDLSLCNAVQVHYINTDSGNKSNVSKDIYIVDDLRISPDDDDVVICSWLIHGNATRYSGSLSFLLKFKCISSDTVETVEYVWNTAIFSGVSVSPGIDNIGMIEESYSDVLAALVAKTVQVIGNGGGGGSGYAVRIVEISLPAAAWQGDESPYSQVVDVPGITANSQVDLTPSVEQLDIFHDKDLAFVTKNAGGVVTVYAIGQKPENDYLIQATIKEVAV